MMKSIIQVALGLSPFIIYVVVLVYVYKVNTLMKFIRFHIQGLAWLVMFILKGFVNIFLWLVVGITVFFKDFGAGLSTGIAESFKSLPKPSFKF